MPEMPREGAQFLAICDVPQLDRLVKTGRGNRLAIRAEADTIDPILMPREGAQFLAIRDIPQLDPS